MGAVTIPPALAAAVDEDDEPTRRPWLARLAGQVEAIAAEWELEVGDPYLPGGQCAWVAPARSLAGEELVLKLGWRHWEAEREAEGLRLWDGDGAVRCHAARSLIDTDALLLERCTPGRQLKRSVPEAEQDVIIAGLLRRLWARVPPDRHRFGSLQEAGDRWAGSLERQCEAGLRGFDPGLARDGIALLRELPGSAECSVLLCTDLHAENVLSAEREPWLVIDPKPMVGDPAFDPVQHMLNCDERLATDPVGLARRMAELTGLDPERVRRWLFARCAQESPEDPTMRRPARRLAP